MDCPLDEEISTAPARRSNLTPNVLSWDATVGAFFKAWLWSDGDKKTLGDFDPQGPDAHRRTVGLDIPCQVARLQSLTPLLQAFEASAAHLGQGATGARFPLDRSMVYDRAKEAPD